MAAQAGDFLQGTLELLVLRTLAWQPMHGYGISHALRERSEETLAVQEAALYQALRRLEAKGYVEAEWRVTENKRRARYYALTSAGESRLRHQTAAWREYAQAVFSILDPVAGAG